MIYHFFSGAAKNSSYHLKILFMFYRISFSLLSRFCLSPWS